MHRLIALLVVCLLTVMGTLSAHAATVTGSGGVSPLPTPGADGECLTVVTGAWESEPCPTAGAPAGATYWVGAAHGSLSAEINLGALGTGLVINTAGTPSIYAGQTCTNQVVRVLGASGAATCVTLTSAYVDSTIIVTSGIGTTYVSPAAAATWADNIRQIFNPGADVAGVNVGSAAAAPGTPVDGDIYHDDTAGIQFRSLGEWVGAGVQAEADTLDTAFDRGKIIDGANSLANAVTIGDGSATPGVLKLYTDATLGPQINCYVSTVENDCNYSRWLLTGKTFSFLANDRTTPIGTVTSAATSGSWTNMTIDAAATGNTITLSSKVNFQAVGCSGTTGSLILDTNATLAPTATCTAGSTNTTLMQGYADFPDSDGEYQFQTNFRLPADWTGAIDLNFRWKAAATTGNVVWQVASLCRTDAEIEDAAWNAADAVTADAAKGTTLQLNDASITGITTTDCAAGEQMYLKFFRQRTHASDTIAGVVSLKAVEMTLRRAQ